MKRKAQKISSGVDTHASPPSSASDSFSIVGIGASAGGLEAIISLLKELPADTGMAFVIVQHLSPHHGSSLTALLMNKTRLRVMEAENDMPVTLNCVYVIPPDTKLAISGGILRVSKRDATGPHLPIDHFLASLAEDRGPLAIGVILSGTGTDGTQGLGFVRAEGGITIAQDKETAKFNGMPRSAVAAGNVDFILPPDEIAKKLIYIGRHPSRARAAPSAREGMAQDEGDFPRIMDALYKSSGVDFTPYRVSTIRRRISRRMLLQSKDTLREYADFLDAEPAEAEALYNDLLINVTAFFRDPAVFDTLKTTVFPELVKAREKDDVIRIWVPGCSTGQEPYSLAMALLEFMDEKKIRLPIQIFATDLDGDALGKAREGLYLQNIEADVSPERLQKFFTGEYGKYRIAKNIRDLCTFAKHNVGVDPPFSRLDLISCRNLLIYLAPPLQKRVIPTFHYALKPHGFLLLGSAETVGAFSDMFDAWDQENRIYIKKLTAARQYPHFNSAKGGAGNGSNIAVGPSPAATRPQVDWLREADRAAVRRYAPAGVLVNDSLDILQFRGRTSPFLESAPGAPSRSLLGMTAAPLFSAVRGATEESRKTGLEACRPNLRIRMESEVKDITVRVLPVQRECQPDRCFLVLFEHETQTPFPQLQPDEGEVSRLQRELSSLHEYLRTVIEEKEAASEELQSSNEEALSSNEELQSTNEELETAKEELQSVNEELVTVNEQLQHRNKELGRLNDDMNNLLSNASIPIVVIDSESRILRTTPKADELFGFSEAGKQRTLSSVQAVLAVPGLEQLLKGAFTADDVQEQEIQGKDGHWWLMRIHGYQSSNSKMKAAVLVLIDIDEIRQTRQRLQDESDFTRAVIETVRESLIVLDAELNVYTANESFYRMFDIGRQDAQSRPFYKMKTGLFDTPELRMLLEKILPEKGFLQNHEIPVTLRRGQNRTLLLNARRILYKGHASELFLLAIEDITERKQLEKELQNHTTELCNAARRKDEFLAMLAHELRNPLAPIGNALQSLQTGRLDRKMVDESYELMQRQLAQLTRLINDLLDVSRIATGKIDLHLETADLNRIIRSAVDTSSPLIETGAHRLDVSLPPKPLWVRADPARLMQAVSNILNNAAKYTPHGGHIWLSAAKEKEEAVVRVKDDGIGIPAEMLDRVFNMFTQVDTSIERAQGGLGIGLTLVKTLVSLHGGSISVTSEGPDRGSEFTIRLPLTKAQPSKGKKREAALAEEAQGVMPQRRILVVDDNRASAKTMGWMLEMAGHRIQLAYDGAQALILAKSFHPEAVLLDIGLPGMSGYEVCRRMRREPLLENTLIIAQTGWGDDEHRRLSKEAGFDSHLVKPVSIDDIIKVLLRGRLEDKNPP